MPNSYILNQVPTGYGAAVALLADMLAAAGWTYKSSGDGSGNFSAAGKVFTHTAGGALGWNNARAWCRLQDPAGVREIVLQHNAANGLRFKYSSATKFETGAPSATVTPSATDERVIQGGGTDAAPTYASAFFAASVASGTYRFQGAAMGDAPFGFWYAGAVTPSGVQSYTAIMMDPVASVPEDPDPYVIYAHGTTGSIQAFRPYLGGGYGVQGNTDVAPGASNIGVWGFMNAAKTSFVYVDPVGYVSTHYDYGFFSGSQVYEDQYMFRGGGLGVNPFNGRDDMIPIVYMRPNAGVKGWSSLARYQCIPRNLFIDTAENKQWIAVGSVWLPWDGVTDPMN